jgi:hypothetical protein
MTNFNWKVNILYTETIDGKQDYVVIANYEVVGTDGTYSASLTNNTRFTTESVTPFIPYEDLTNDIVVGWIKQDLGVDGVSNFEASIQGQIDYQINPPVVPVNTTLPPNFYTTTTK